MNNPSSDGRDATSSHGAWRPSTPGTPPSPATGTSSTSSGSPSFSERNPDEERIFQLTWTDVLGTAIGDVAPQPEPVCTFGGCPILAIDYSPSFSFTLGLYRSLRPSMTSAVRTPGPKLAAQLAATRALRSRLARWLLLTAFTIRQCASHYTAWSDRREIILNPTALWAATREQLSLPLLDLPNETAGQDADALRRLRESCEDVAFRYSEVMRTWLPSDADLPPDAMSTIAADTLNAPVLSSSPLPTAVMTAQLTVKALLHGIVWELSACGSFARMYHKNFQVWHHRQSIIEFALQRMVDVEAASRDRGIGDCGSSDITVDSAARDAALSRLLHSEAALAQRLKSLYGIGFDAIDERIVSAAVIETIDSKNYHVWIHRSTFVHRFSFLVQGPPRERWRSEWLAFCGPPGSSPRRSPVFLRDANWLDQNACIESAPVPSSAPIKAEFDFCAVAISTDCFNNSAWCHRSLLLREDVVPGLLRAFVAPHAATPEGERLSLDELLHVLFIICRREIDYALQWACVRPSNECAYVYARAVGELYQSAAMRLHLHAAILTQRNAESESPDVLLTGPLHPPVSASCMGSIINRAEPGSPAVRVESPDLIARFFLNANTHLSWVAHLSTFELLRYQQDVMHTTISPLVDEVEGKLHNVLGELARLAETIADPVELAKARAARLAYLYGNSAQYLIDNLYQVRASMYHCLFSFLELTWLLYWRREQRAAVVAARPPAAYARHGVTEEMVPQDAWCSGCIGGRELSETDYFLEKEAMALKLAKLLIVEDSVRAKYWRHEARTVMQREY